MFKIPNTYPYASILCVIYPSISISTKLNLVTFHVVVFSITKGSYFCDQISTTKINLYPLLFIISLDGSEG